MAKKSGKVLLLVGTKKGGFVFTSDHSRRKWKLEGHSQQGKEIPRMVYDGRTGTLMSSLTWGHWGPTVVRSKDLGKTWKESKTPPKYPKGSGLSVERVWEIEPGREDEPEVVYAGVAPACLFRSEDGGASWKINEAMLNHKTRKKWQPGAGGMCLHSIVLDERRPKRILIAISAVGVMRSDDDGETWKFQNKNLGPLDYQPNHFPEYGHCIHRLAHNPAAPDSIFMQAHFGVFKTENAGESWTDVRDNLPSRFGFPAAVDANERKRVYVAPLEGDFSRIPPGGHMAIWTSDKGGGDWQKLDKGLPVVAYYTVLREAMTTDKEDPCGVYFGTTTGHLWAGRDQGNEWERVSDALPPILSVSAYQI